jgi:hypothetical protein
MNITANPSFEVIVDLYMPIFKEEPEKIHELKSWMDQRAYHGRIQKKWNKRFGIKKERLFYVIEGNKVLTHPVNAELIRHM